jgi:glutamate synthase (NADPH) small chain
MEQARLRELEEQCIQDCVPPCSSACPLHVDVRQLVQAIRNEDYSGGTKVFRKSVPFPEIVARTCDEPCRQHCNRAKIGGEIEVAALELACLSQSNEPPAKWTILPKKKARVAVLGGGLSGITAAFDLARKGYSVSLFEWTDHLGGRLWQYSEDLLPRAVLLRELDAICQVGVELHLGRQADPRDLSAQYDAVYLGPGQDGAAGFDLAELDRVTFQFGQTNVFGGGSWLHAPSTIFSISDGRRAAISIDRFLQKVSLTASRVNEGAYDTCLVTNISEIPVVDVRLPADPAAGFSPAEAKAEADRCLLCECMECVKVCEYLKHYNNYPRKYVREIYNNLSIIMRTRTANKFINSCTLCGLCKEVCPTDFDMGQVNKEVRRTMVQTKKMPASAHDFALRDMAFSNSPRFADVFLPAGKETCGDLFFPGCQLAASNPEYVDRLCADLRGILPEMGVMLGCCGAPADWSGEEDIFNATILALRERWQDLGRPRLVLACSSCNRVFKEQFPEVETISVWELFEQHGLFPADKRSDRRMVVHDPCTSRYETAWQDSARAGLKRMGVEFGELKMSRNLTECCGYGGVAWLANPEMVQDIIDRRVHENEADYVTYCVMCRDLFANRGKPTLHLLDLLYGQDLNRLAVRRPPNYSQRHENRIRARGAVARQYSRKEVELVETYDHYQLILSDEIRNRLEDRLILVEDVQKVVEFAETSGMKFLNNENGHVLSYFRPNLITYWVEYTPEDGGYRIHDAYSHRMEFEGDSRL